MQGFDHQLVSIRQGELQAEARRHRLVASEAFEVPVQPVAVEATAAHRWWRGIVAQPRPAGPVTHGHRS